MPYLDVSYLIDLYITLKRMVYKNTFIKLPKNIEKFNQQMQEVTDIINEYHIEPVDFLNFMVRWYSPMRIFPQPYHLKAEKALRRYLYHQTLKNKYVFDDYSIDGDEFTINETYETVSYGKDIGLPIDKDLRLKYAMHLANYPTGNLIHEPKSIRDIAYAIVKLRFLGKPIPNELMKLKERVIR
jgi:hypothetical protein